MAKYKRGSLALARQVFNTPQLIVEEDLQRISQYLVDRANGVEANVISNEDAVNEKVELESLRTLAQYTTEEEKQRYHKRLNITNDGKRGNLYVTGALVPKAGEIDADCMELTSYEKLFSTFQMQVKEGINELLLHVDSGGGSAFSVFEMATEVKDLANKNNIKIISYIDGLSASAAYAWTSIADEIIARPDSEVGSIGVVVQLINNTKMLENIGITRKFITYGESKVPFDDKGEFTDKFLNSLQKKVDKTGLEFTSFVAKNRNMKVEDVIATQAEVFDSEMALELGLIDKIMTRSEFFNEYLPSLNSNSFNQYNLQQENNMTKENDIVSVESLQAQLDDVRQELNLANEDKVELTTKLSEATEQLTQLEDLKTELTELKESHASLVAEKEEVAKQAKSDARKAQLEAALGKDNEQVATLLASTESLADEQFDVIAKSLSSNIEAKQEQFKELGGEGQKADVQAELEQTLEQKLAAKAANMSKQ